jgi:hypothetical protein
LTKLKFLSPALVAAAMLATPVMARESQVSSRHLAENVDTSTTPEALYLREGDGFHRHESHDVWGHWGTYYGPMIPSVR